MSSVPVAKKSFIGQAVEQQAWLQGVCVVVSGDVIVIDDGTGVVPCLQLSNTVRGGENVEVGSYIQAIGELKVSGEKKELITHKLFVLEDVNMESLWFTEVPQAQAQAQK